MTTGYMKVYSELRARIESSEFPVGGKLPGISALQEQYTTSLTTIRKAQQMLVDDGLLSTKQGRGAFVISNQAAPRSDGADGPVGRVAIGIRINLIDQEDRYVGALVREDVKAAALPRVGDRLAPGTLGTRLPNVVSLSPVVESVDHYLHIPRVKEWDPLAIVVLSVGAVDVEAVQAMKAELVLEGWSVTFWTPVAR